MVVLFNCDDNLRDRWEGVLYFSDYEGIILLELIVGYYPRDDFCLHLKYFFLPTRDGLLFRRSYIEDSVRIFLVNLRSRTSRLNSFSEYSYLLLYSF
jgi:hypothetical protein